MIESLGKAKEKIIAADRIAISGHINPDGDSIGSLLSLGLGLESLGKHVYMISCDGVPRRYRKLPGADRVVRSLDKPVDLAISVDCSNKELLGSAYRTFEEAAAILEIDHHEFRRPYGDIALIDEKAAAVGEIIYYLLKDLGARITRDVAQNLLTSIIVETSSFRLPNVRAFTFNVCAELVSLGVDFYSLVETIFWSRTRESALLSGICLSRVKFLKSGRVAWSIINKSDFKRVKGRDEDVDAIPDEIRSINKVDVAVLFRENGNGDLRVSLRSKDGINVAGIAEHYGGGGHFDVAGCTIPNRPRDIREFLDRSGKLVK